MVKIPLFISTYNRINITRESLTSLIQSELPEHIEVIINDDGSTQSMLNMIQEDYSSFVLIKNQHRGIPNGKILPIQAGLKNFPDIPYFFISDSDMIYTKYWVQTLEKIYSENTKESKVAIVTGFDTAGNGHKVIRKLNKFTGIKASVGGANLLVDKEFYDEEPFRNRGWDWTFSKRARGKDRLLITTVPSIVEHIGVHGTFSRPNRFDSATRFVGQNQDSRMIMDGTMGIKFESILIIVGGDLNEVIAGTRMVKAIQKSKKSPGTISLYVQTPTPRTKDLLRGGNISVYWAGNISAQEFDKAIISTKFNERLPFRVEEQAKFNPTAELVAWSKIDILKIYELEVDDPGYYVPSINKFLSKKRKKGSIRFKTPEELEAPHIISKISSREGYIGKTKNWEHVFKVCGCSI